MLSSQIEYRVSFFLSLFIFMLMSFQKSWKSRYFSLSRLMISKKRIRKDLIIIKLCITKIIRFIFIFNNLFLFFWFYPVIFFILFNIILPAIAKRQKLIWKNWRHINVSFIKWFLRFLFRLLNWNRFRVFDIWSCLNFFLFSFFGFILPNELKQFGIEIWLKLTNRLVFFPDIWLIFCGYFKLLNWLIFNNPRISIINFSANMEILF